MLKLLIHILHMLLTSRSSTGRGAVRRGDGNRTMQTAQNPVGLDRPGSRRSLGATMRRAQRQAAILLSLLIGFIAPAEAFNINNTAQADMAFSVTGPQSSNTVTVGVLPEPSLSTVDFLAITPNPTGTSIPATSSSSDGTDTGVLTTILPTPGPADLTPTESFGGLSELAIRLTDADRNIDPLIADTIQLTVRSTLTGDYELLELTETGLNTGIFLGHIPLTKSATVAFDAQIYTDLNDTVTVDYLDPINGDSCNDTALVDPLGIVFNSLTGDPVDDITVNLYRLADENDPTGVLATGHVFDDDGITPFPASVTTGSSTYSYPPGGFRFPLVAPGFYRFEVIPINGYAFPSTADLDSGLPYIVVTGSKGETFEISPGPVINIDIPIDPPAAEMWLTKQVNYSQASIGDFLQYHLTLENTNDISSVPGAVINDRLPLSFRYQSGSTRIDGKEVADPQISDDGRHLTFTLGDLPPASLLDVTYVVEVAAGARSGQAVNLAQAIDNNNNQSQQASAVVVVREEFFRNSTFLLGRVMVGSCSEPDTAKAGLPGVKIYLEDGSYIVTDKDGKYHFEGVEPGLHVVQVDTFSLPEGYEMLPCEQTSQFAGRSFSQFVDLQGGTLWQVNFHTAAQPPPSGEITLALQASLDGETATFTATAKAHRVAASNLQLTVMLPGGFNYLSGSALHNNQAADDPQIADGSITFTLAELAADATTTFSFNARLKGHSASEELPVKAVLGFDTLSAKEQHTPPAETMFRLQAGQPGRSEELRLYPLFPSFIVELQNTDRAMLEDLANRLRGQKIVRLDVVGHTDNQKISTQSKHIFADNQALSVARAQNVANFLKQRLTIQDEGISIRGMGKKLPVSDNKTEAGRALNRRVEIYVVSENPGRNSSLTLTQPASPTQSVTTTGPSLAGEGTLRQQSAAQKDSADKGAAKGILAPTGDKAVSRTESIRIRLESGLKPRISLDQQEIPDGRLGFTMNEPDSGTTLYTYIGVDFGEPGTHKLLVEGIGPFGNARFEQEVELIRTGAIASIRLLEVADNIADGRTPVRIRVELIDEFGRQVQSKVNLALESTELSSLGDKNHNKDSDLDAAKLGKQVIVDSQGWISFNPVEISGRFPIRLLTDGADMETDIYVKPAMRDWVLVGFAEGTVGYDDLSGNQVNLEEAGIDEHYYDDGQVKFFAKGAIKGEFLLTMAYDSDKPNRDGESLHQIIDPDNYYPLYGDGTQQGYEASSASKLFVKIERDQFYALFGDMQTGLNQTELSRYDRNMSGFKSEIQTYNFSYTVFAAETKQAFAKDELRGDGTSGRYYLTQKGLVTNSETITIETRDRFHSEQVLDTQTLARHTDYNIDYDDGSLFFKRPIASKDESFNPIFIVARYETLDSADENLNYGGRVATKILDQRVEVGASYVHEETGESEGDLYGADITVALTPQTTLHAEAASTDSSHYDTDHKGDAYLAEVTHNSNRVQGNVYFREQQEGFGLGQQNESETGTRKYGTQGSFNITPQHSLIGQIYHEDNLSTGAERDVAELAGRYTAERYGLHSGLREARDSFEGGESQQSTQWLLGGNWTTPDRKLNLRSDYEQSLGNKNGNSDYPTLLTLGADYKLTERISVFSEQEFSWGDNSDTEGTRVGFNATPWQGGDMHSTVEQQTTENSQRVFALFGLGQSWQATAEWSFDASIDRSYTIKDTDSEQFNKNVPPAHGGDDDFTAVSVGATRRVDKWTWWNRLETRQADTEDKYGISTSVVGEPQNGIAVSAMALAFISEVSDGSRRSDGNIRLGMAYRPNASRWIVLNRLDFYFDKVDHSLSEYDNWRIVNHLHANFRLSRKTQMSFYYGLKYVRDNFNGSTYSGFTDMIAFETRYNINKKWDVGVHGSILHSWNSGTFQYSAGGDIGYSPVTNTWVSLGYNLVGFEDEDFSDANYTAEGAYLRFRAKFDQQSVREAAEWINK